MVPFVIRNMSGVNFTWTFNVFLINIELWVHELVIIETGHIDARFKHEVYTWVMWFSAGEDFCHTLHIMDSKGESVVVNKKCADESECSPQLVGCLSIDTQTVSPQSYSVQTASVLQVPPFCNDLSKHCPDCTLQRRFWSWNFVTAPRIIIHWDS